MFDRFEILTKHYEKPLGIGIGIVLKMMFFLIVFLMIMKGK